MRMQRQPVVSVLFYAVMNFTGLLFWVDMRDNERKIFQMMQQFVANVGSNAMCFCHGQFRRDGDVDLDKFAAGLLPLVEAVRSAGATTLAAISEALNERSIRTARGGSWHVSSVLNLLARAHRLAPAR